MASELRELVEQHGARFVDLRYADWREGWRHLTLAAAQALDDRGILTSDGGRRLRPVPQTAFLDPFYQHPTITVLCDVEDVVTGTDHADDSRALARRTAAFLRESGVAEEARFEPALEFFVFDQASFAIDTNAAHYRVDSREGFWRSGREEGDNLGTQVDAVDGTGCLPPADSLHNLRAEMVEALEACGVPATGHWRGPATGGHGAIGLRAAPLPRIADHVVIAKYVIRNVAARHGKVATFMPQPLVHQPGSALLTRMSLWNAGQPLRLADDDGEMSRLARHVVGGWLTHGRSVVALTCPTTNSYKRIAGFGGADVLTCAREDPCRVVDVPLLPAGLTLHELIWQAIEPVCDPHLGLSALLMAAIDGARRGLEWSRAAEQADAGEAEERALLPRSLAEALRCLESDRAYLQEGGVFVGEMLESWIAEKREEDELHASLPTPQEFCLYFNA